MDKFCLKWNSFEENIRKLREDQRLFDVTLATDDGQHIQAHKVILSAGSHFFSDIFEKSNHTNMLVYLKGISSEKLEEVLDFIYNGEVSIGQEEIKVFIETGNELQVKGLDGELTGIGENTAEESKSYQDTDENDTYYEDAENVDRNIVEGLDTQATTVAQTRAGNIQANAHNDLTIQATEMIEKNEGVWKCKVCGKTETHKGNIREHVERNHLEGMFHACHLCSKTFKNRPALQQHISNIHTELFSCDICLKAGMSRAGYRMHKKRQHKISPVNISI